ncbi:MAG TPA: helix-hairpin-helix domain-containing protein [Ktedonosporobacter sp.]|nr:helix-hairpin-helix domain-containing protein [Ktedonosporobacter sp.]
MSIMQLTQTIQILPTRQSRGSKRPTQPALPGMELEPEVRPKVTNRQIAEVLSGIADLIEAQNGNPYRIQAYRNAARGVLDLPEPAADILTRGETLPIPGLGERLRMRIAELVQLGTMTFQNGLCMQTLPAGVRTLMSIEHIGPYTAIRLHEELGIDSPKKLWWAAQQQQIRKLPGFGVRSEARLKAAAEKLLKKDKDKEQPLGGAA